MKPYRALINAYRDKRNRVPAALRRPAPDQIEWNVNKLTDGLFTVTFANLTKAEAGQMLQLLDTLQRGR